MPREEGFLIASIAVIHIYVAHLAVGGGLFLIPAEKKAYKSNDSLIHTFVFGESEATGDIRAIILFPRSNSTIIPF
ncbi:MAG: hypothetical protein K8S13_23530 [Desulfobacula sp.]|uniref:hypothetical protein n=1 Tax=Desulfobacula sp. TaxID=2593537 RepID=UPI0025B9631E|nr:hypothetical protein [Desulfobacula sp.]MCD4722801.1 hypothetical protein [Desulfobacula sp.]